MVNDPWLPCPVEALLCISSEERTPIRQWFDILAVCWLTVAGLLGSARAKAESQKNADIPKLARRP